MQKEPMVYAVAGMIFGFVLGYMVANVGERAEARPPVGGAFTAAAPEPGTTVGKGRAAPLDPNEVRALESLAGRDRANAQVRVELGNLYMDHERYEDAVRWYREALGLKPDDLNARVDLGACLVNMGRAGDALGEFDLALKKDPTHKKALFNKGVALMQSGRPQDAVAVWEDLLKRYPGDPLLVGLREQIERAKGAGGKPS